LQFDYCKGNWNATSNQPKAKNSTYNYIETTTNKFSIDNFLNLREYDELVQHEGLKGGGLYLWRKLQKKYMLITTHNELALRGCNVPNKLQWSHSLPFILLIYKEIARSSAYKWRSQGSKK